MSAKVTCRHLMELVIAGQCCQPKGELRQVGGHLVLIHTVKTTLRHNAASLQQFVFIRGNGGPSLWICQEVTKASPNCRHVSTRNAPDPIAGSQTFSARICSGRGLSPSFLRIGDSAVSTIGCSIPRSIAGCPRNPKGKRHTDCGRPGLGKDDDSTAFAAFVRPPHASFSTSFNKGNSG